MDVIVNTDHNITMDETSIEQMKSSVQSSLGHFTSHLTRVEVHLTDGSAGRSTGDDIRCKLEARPEGLDPEFTTDNAASAHQALAGALTKMRHVLDTTLGKREEHKGNSSMGGVEPR